MNYPHRKKPIIVIHVHYLQCRVLHQQHQLDHLQKNSRQHLKRCVSPTITLAVERSSEKRRQQRKRRKGKIHDDIEQENDDDKIISIKSKNPRQRQSSNSSVEYVQTINNDQQSISSIENIKSKSPSDDEDIIVCHSSSSVKRKSMIIK